ncbi:MAG: citrate transporter [Oscillospiraceae bacterium]|nr:citrate transporter [Oscillospiraceae bacterium]
MIIKKIYSFIKNETVLSIAAILAVISSFFVKPDIDYLGYIDFRTLALLFCLMAVMAGLQKTGVFNVLAQCLLKRVHGIKGLTFILVMLCFFFSMLITNDVALITFVPFTFTVLNIVDKSVKDKLIIPVVVMQTIAANLGSMLTPIGNPQNLYLQGISGLGVGEFIALMLPYAAISFVMLSIWIFIRRDKGGIKISFTENVHIGDKKRIIVYLVAFIVCLLTVARVLDYKLTLLIVIALISAADYKIFAKVDYTLLLTFIAFFVFIGNMGRIPVFEEYLKSVIDGRECITGVLSSQLISNVPAALLLSGFTDKFKELIIGVNLGGLGTLIASMASLISFKLLGRENKSLRGKYLIYFTVSNIFFLAVLLAAYYVF